MPIPRQTIGTQYKRYYQSIAPVIKKRKFRTSTAAVFSFLAASLFLWYAVRPTAQTIIYLQREIADKTVVNQQMETKITALIEAQATYENIKDRLPILEQALPHNPNAIFLAKQIKNIAALSNATISAMQVPSVPVIANEATVGAKLTAVKPLEEFTMTVVFAGQYDAIRSVLSNIAKLRRITGFDMITIRPAAVTKSDTPNTLQMSIRLKSYYSQQ